MGSGEVRIERNRVPSAGAVLKSMMTVPRYPAIAYENDFLMLTCGQTYTTYSFDVLVAERSAPHVSASRHAGRALDRVRCSIAKYGLKTNKARAIGFSTLDALCRELDCQPGELLECS